MNTVLTKKHYSATIDWDMDAICEPLKQYGITHFLHSRFFYDNSAYVLTQNWDAYYHHVQNQYVVSSPIPKMPHGNRFHYLPTLSKDKNKYKKTAQDWSSIYNIDHPIYFIESYSNYTDLFIFSSTTDNPEIINFYLNNIDFLEKFKFYFKDKAYRLIEKSNNNKIMVPAEIWSDFNLPLVKQQEARNKKIKQLITKHYRFAINQNEVAISKRELDIIQILARGCTIKEAAQDMEISPRTAESYLRNIRYKLKMHNKAEIINLFEKINLL